MSVTAAQSAANIANAQLSTGPKTEEGKQRSSQNAVQHGIFAKSPVDDVAVAEFRRFLEEYTAEFQPKRKLELDLVRTIADTQWRLKRCRHAQDLMLMSLASSLDNLKELDKFSLYETRLNRMLHTSLRSLKETQAERKQAEEKALAEAAAIAKHFESKQMEYDPREDGFVFSASELGSYIRRNDRLEEAKNARLSHNRPEKTTSDRVRA